MWLAVNIAAGAPSRPGGEVGLVGRAEADGDDVGAAAGRAARERGGEAGRRVAHVVADDDSAARGADLVDEARGEGLDALLREPLAHDSADVVGLHDGVEARASLGGCCRIHALKPTSPSDDVPHDLPAHRSGRALGVAAAEVVAVGLGREGERARAPPWSRRSRT